VGFDGDGSVAIDWGVYGTPETFVIDKVGVIRYKFIGPLTDEVWQEEVLPVIKRLQEKS
jgi:cytochrome c biogenesis protein CcmG/thiol:disulfide interchange protein DsbE